MARASARVVSDLVYAAITEFGGIIDAPTMGGPSQVLVFEGEAGETVYVRRVYHPAQPFMRPGFQLGKDRAVDAAANVLRRAIGL